jgi:hypothetical protein
VQALLAQFSAANSQLAVENDKLRSGRKELATDHKDVLSEIEFLRGRLALLEGAAAHLERQSPAVLRTTSSENARRSTLRQFDTQSGYVRSSAAPCSIRYFCCELYCLCAAAKEYCCVVAQGSHASFRCWTPRCCHLHAWDRFTTRRSTLARRQCRKPSNARYLQFVE